MASSLTVEEEQRLAALTPEELRQLKELRRPLQSRMARERLIPFCELMSPGFIAKDFIRLLAEHLEAIERGDIRFLMINMPPRHGKSHTVSENFPAWYMGRHPDRHVVICSYAEGLAQTFNDRVKGRVISDAWPFRDVHIRPDLAGKEEWGTTKGGTCRAKGTQGGITGRGAHLFLMDDLIADAEEARSDPVKDAKWAWYQETAHTRLEPRGAVVMPCTRWAEDDVAGRILNSESAKDWTVLVMPALAEPNVGSDIASHVREVVTLHNRVPGEALFPERYDEAELGRIKAAMSALSWSALYQQRPSSAEGNLFKRDWWGYWTEGVPPVVQGRRIVRKPKKFVRVYHFVDSAFKTGIANDFSVCATWAKDDRENFYLLSLWRDRVEFPSLVDRLERIYLGLRAPIVIEDKASGQSAIQVLRSMRKARVVPAKYKGDHADRAESVTQFVEGGKVFLPWDAPWVEAFIEEHAKFPTGAHDDQVDTTSMALLKLDKVKAGRAPSTYELGEVKPTAKTWDIFGEHSRQIERNLEDRLDFESRFI